MSIGWMATLAEADTYFFTERISSSGWDGLVNDAAKTRALNNAYNRIYYLKDYSIPSSPTAAQLVILKKAQCEMTEYLAIHLADEDRRKGLQAQGVAGAGIVKETYVRFGSDVIQADDVPVPPFVKQLLESFAAFKNTPFYSVDIDRDEDEAVSEDVTDL